MMAKAIARATLVAGTLDLLSAAVLTLLAGRPVAGMLSRIAAGPFGDGMVNAGMPAALLGVAVHFVLMGIFAAIFAFVAARLPVVVRNPIPAGIAYGLAVYVVMYWIVVPLRWPPKSMALTFDKVGVPILIHILLVGLPISVMICRALRERGDADRPL